MGAGCKDKQSVFLFSDTQVQRESFLEDISNILNTVEVPNLFAADEKATPQPLESRARVVEFVRWCTGAEPPGNAASSAAAAARSEGNTA